MSQVNQLVRLLESLPEPERQRWAGALLRQLEEALDDAAWNASFEDPDALEALDKLADRVVADSRKRPPKTFKDFKQEQESRVQR